MGDKLLILSQKVTRAPSSRVYITSRRFSQVFVITFFLSAIPQVAKQLALVIFLPTLLLPRVSFFVSARIS
jgi:hypothetical protein